MRPLLCALLLAALPVLEVNAGGRIEVRVTDHRAGIEDFHEVKIALSEVSLHRSGASRRNGWVTVLRESRAVDIVPLKDGRWEAAGVGQVPTGQYDAIRVTPSVREVRHKGGLPVSVGSAAATVMFHDILGIAQGTVLPVLLDFYVEDQTDHAPPRYVLKLRHVALGKPAAQGGTTGR